MRDCRGCMAEDITVTHRGYIVGFAWKKVYPNMRDRVLHYKIRWSDGTFETQPAAAYIRHHPFGPLTRDY